MITTSPKGATHAGRRIPKFLSKEYLPGPLSRRAVEIAVFVTGSSAPPSVTQIGLLPRLARPYTNRDGVEPHLALYHAPNCYVYC